jgi:RND family efflux transporter MFP subunit
MRVAVVVALVALAAVPPVFAAPPPPAAAVRQVKPTRRDITLRLLAPVTIEPVDAVEVPAPAPGLIAAVLVDVGARVKRGEVLARIALLDASGRVRGKANVLAPVDSVVTARSARLGAYAAPGGRPLFTLMDPSRLLAGIEVPETRIVQVRAGQRVSVSLAALPHRVYQSVVQRKGLIIDRATRTARVEAPLENADLALMVGMSGQAVIELAARRDALVVPRAAVVREAGGTWVFRLDGNRARRAAVKIGIEDDAAAEILQGVGERDVLLVSDAPLRDGASVEVR